MLKSMCIYYLFIESNKVRMHHKYNYLILHNYQNINRIHHEIPIAFSGTSGHYYSIRHCLMLVLF